MKCSTRLAAALALVAALVPSPTTRAAAQTTTPDIRGHYLVGGSATVYDCTFVELNDVVAVAYEPIDILTQDGDQFTGGIGVPTDGSYAADLSGTVSPTGALSGTWKFVDDPSGGTIHDYVLTGQVTDGKLSLVLTAVIGDSVAYCLYRLDLTPTAALLEFQPPDPNDTTQLAPPRALTLTALAPPPGAKAPSAGLFAPSRVAPPPAVARDTAVMGYNVYRSSTPDVQPTQANLYAQLPPTQTTVPTAVDPSGSFFVVTATYPTGESGPSNEVSGGLPAATIASVKVSPTKLKAVGTGFTSTVQVFVDGIPFVAPAKVKGGVKVNQKGNLITGQSLGQYMTHGKIVAITFRNANGGIATNVYTAP